MMTDHHPQKEEGPRAVTAGARENALPDNRVPEPRRDASNFNHDSKIDNAASGGGEARSGKVDRSVFRRLVRDKRLSHGAFRLWHLLHDYADSEGRCFPGMKLLSAIMGSNKNQVAKWRDELTQAGYLTWLHGGNGKRSNYTLSEGREPVPKVVPVGSGRTGTESGTAPVPKVVPVTGTESGTRSKLSEVNSPSLSVCTGPSANTHTRREGAEGAVEVPDVEAALAMTKEKQIPEDFCKAIYGDWSARNGCDGSGSRVQWLPYVCKRWTREGQQWIQGAHYLQQSAGVSRSYRRPSRPSRNAGTYNEGPDDLSVLVQ